MVDIDSFFRALKESIEDCSTELQNGKLFGPEYLKGKVFSNNFQKVAETIGNKLSLNVRSEHRNTMPEPVDHYGHWQQVDFAYSEKSSDLCIYLELETLDRAQLYLFCDIELGDGGDIDENKLWYYLGTIKKRIVSNEPIPRYFVWLLILPDKRVEPYPANLWDIKGWGKSGEYILHPSLKDLIFENPYRFYDHLIKTSARLFISRQRDELEGKSLAAYQDTCELIFLTCTGDQLIMSRGNDLFDSEKEIPLPINWK